MLEQHFGAVRFVYNRSLFIKNLMYDKFGISLTEVDLNNNLTILKEHFPWLNDINSQSLQQANRNLLTGFKNFFEGNADHPTRKSKKDNLFSFHVPQNYQVNLTTSQIYLPKIGWMKIVLHRDFLSKEFRVLKTLTVSRTSAGRYHVSILIEDHEPYPEPEIFTEETTVGIDVGIKSFAVLSTREEIDNPKFLKRSLKKLVKLQRNVSRN